MIEISKKINDDMPHVVFSRLKKLLWGKGLAHKISGVLIVGVSYKQGVSDTRESPAVKIASLLIREGYYVEYHDPFVRELVVDGHHVPKFSKLHSEGSQYATIILQRPEGVSTLDFPGFDSNLVLNLRGSDPS
jgi:UDP-N-acetyl-D-glucosamine dehydrogenase